MPKLITQQSGISVYEMEDGTIDVIDCFERED